RSRLRATRCALTAPFHPYLRRLAWFAHAAIRWRRYVLCCTGRLCALKHTSRTLSGTLPCGVRTFLPLAKLAPARRRSSSRLLFQCIADQSRRTGPLRGGCWASRGAPVGRLGIFWWGGPVMV